MTMPDPLSLRLASLLLKPASYVAKFAYGKLQKRLWVYSVLKKWGLAVDKDDFDSIYVQTLYDVLQGGAKNRNLIKLFELKEVRATFKERLYEASDWSPSTELPFDLRNHKSFSAIRHYNIDIEREIMDFHQAFQKNVNRSRTPKELDSNDRFARDIDSLKQQISENSLASRPVYHAQLDGIYTILVKQFTVQSAAELLQQVIANVEISALPLQERQELMAKAYFMLGRCKLRPTAKESTSHFNIKSYELQPQNIDYKSRACLAYFVIGDKERARELADSILSRDDRENERAYVAKLALAKDGENIVVPDRTRRGITFRTLYPQIVPQREKVEVGSEIYSLLSPEIGDQLLPDINADSIDFWDVVGRMAYVVGINAQPHIPVAQPSDYRGSKHVVRAHQVLKAIVDRIQV